MSTVDELGGVEHVATCRCGGFSKDHDVVFHYWPDSQYGDELTITTGLCHFRPWYKRLWVAIKYTLGIDNTHHFYVENTLNEKSVKELAAFMNDVASKFKERP